MPETSAVLSARFEFASRPCTIHGGEHTHVKACTVCMAPLVDNKCSGDATHVVSSTNRLGTWGAAERWRCVEHLLK